MADFKYEDVTPMMQQYLDTKKTVPDCILFYRLGDFYEMFFDDAKLVSKELELTLTGKSCGLEERAPMCGIPYHAVEGYLSKLVQKGYKVAICEQVEDPAAAKGLVKREIVRIVTPGTNLNVSELDSDKNNFLTCIFYTTGKTGLASVDVTTGDFFVTQLDSLKDLDDEFEKYDPSEIICNAEFMLSGYDTDLLKRRREVSLNTIESHFFDEAGTKRTLLKHFKCNTLIGIGLDEFEEGSIAAGALLSYLYDLQKNDLSHITHINPYMTGKYMLLDHSSRRNLELTETMRDKEKRGSLLWVLDKTKTAMGARNLRNFINKPLVVKEEIEQRLDAVEELCKNGCERDEIREYLNSIYDLERLLSKVIYQTINPRDLLAFKASLQMLPAIKSVMQDFSSKLLSEICNELDPLKDIYTLIEESITEEPPLSIREGGFIKSGFNNSIDTLREAKQNGKGLLANIEEEDRERTGIKNLKIKYNKVFGYYFEVTNSFLELVPSDYIRKQTLVGAERFTTPKLKELEDIILNADDKLCALEYDIFCKIRETIASNISRIQKLAKNIAELDTYCSLSYVAERNHYVRPSLNEKGVINIKEGRHPVIELICGDSLFVSNDTFLDNKKNAVSIITGPNMAGKSTYMRQSALIVLMAQLGSYVPAAKADIGIVDRIFTRVGASDDLASGQSTFMVEMNEVSNILRNATSNSLLILDEIGRGTSTFDGLSIAWSVVEYISNRNILGAKTLFATHYHELTELEGKIDNVNNYCIAVKESDDNIVFLRKIVKGGADKSYGILVAKLAGVPDMVCERAKQIANELSNNDITEKLQNINIENRTPKKTKKVVPDEVDLGQMSFANMITDSDILNELSELEIQNMTPLDAMNALYSLQSKLKNRW